MILFLAKVEKLKMEVNRRANEQQKKVKERAGEAKRVQDLERQVRHTLLSYSQILKKQLIHCMFVHCVTRELELSSCVCQ